uniref:Pre-mRNA-splicing factor 3 domain-containing protein n=1 Tax=Plectus sambesii TaxID=2011161 RepID=A0A914V0G0_9BILA
MGDDKRKVIEKLVRKVLDHRDDKIVSVVQKCLDRGYDYRKMKDRLNDEIRDGSKSGKLAECVLEEFPTTKKRPKFEEEKNGQEGEANGGEAKKPKVDAAHIEQDLKVKELMSQAQRTIEERKRQLNLPATPAMSGLNRTMLQSSKLAPAEAEKYMALTMEKQSRANELRAKIANRFSAISTLPSAIAAVSALTKPTPLLLDNTGRQIDPLGNEFQVPKQTPTLKANIRAEKRELFRRAQLEVEQPAKPAPSADDADAPGYLDPRLSQRGAMRQRRQFKFHERGEFEQLANKQRAKAKLEKLQAEISQAAKNTGISSAVKLAMVAPKHETSDKEVPLMEWWDSVVLDGKEYVIFVHAVHLLTDSICSYDCLPSVSGDKTKVMD